MPPFAFWRFSCLFLAAALPAAFERFFFLPIQTSGTFVVENIIIRGTGDPSDVLGRDHGGRQSPVLTRDYPPLASVSVRWCRQVGRYGLGWVIMAVVNHRPHSRRYRCRYLTWLEIARRYINSPLPHEYLR